MTMPWHSGSCDNVALRKESVDRNWPGALPGAYPRVALRKESVDRNLAMEELRRAVWRRSPQGERG